MASDLDPAEVRRRMDGLGLRGGAFPLPVDWRGDDARFRSDLDSLPRLAAAASTLGLTRTGTWVRPETDRPAPGTDLAAHRAAAFDWHAERLAAIARVLEPHGIRMGLEVLGPITCRTGAGLPLFDRLGGPDLASLLGRLAGEWRNVGLLVDAFHLYAAGEDMAAGWVAGIERVVWVHVADLPASASPDRSAIQDRDRGLPGEHGAVDAPSLLRGLANLGYDGPVTAEPMAGCRSLAGLDPDGVARAVATALASVWPG